MANQIYLDSAYFYSQKAYEISKDLDDSIGVQVNGELKKIIMFSLWYVVACVDGDSVCDVFLLSDIEESMQVFKRGMLFPFIVCI